MADMIVPSGVANYLPAYILQITRFKKTIFVRMLLFVNQYNVRQKKYSSAYCRL